MGLFSIDGLASGLDTTKIIEALVERDRAPLDRIKANKAKATDQITAFQTLNARLLSLRVSAGRLFNANTFRGRGVSSSDTELLNATVTTQSTPGSHSVVIHALAQAHQISSDTFATQDTALSLAGDILVNGRAIRIEATDDLSEVATKINNSAADVSASVVRVNTGDFRLSIRQRNPGATALNLADASGSNVLAGLKLVNGTETLATSTATTAKSRGLSNESVAAGTLLSLTSPLSGNVSFDDDAPFSVNIDLATDSLEGIVTKFNAAKGASTMTATIVEEQVSGQTVQRIQFTKAGGIAATDFTDNNNVLETLGVLAPTVTNEDQAAQDAHVSVNGLDIYRSSNTISDAISGVTLFLGKADPAETVTLSVTKTNTDAVDAIQKFVTDYNSTIGYIRENAAYDTETGEKGILLGDSTVLGVQNSLFRVTQSQVPKLPTAALSSLNDGAGVRAGSIKITDRAGGTATVNLSSASTVQEVINKINSTTGIKVKASINNAGTALVLTDSSGGTNALKVEEDGSFTAQDLGIEGEANSNTYFGNAVASREFLNLSSIGISATAAGTLNLNIGELNQALENDPAEVEALFTTAQRGIGALATQQLDFLTNSRNGQLKAKTEGLQSTIERFDKDIENFEDRIERIETRLRLQFASLESTLAQMQTQSQYVQNQLSQMSNINNRR